MYCCNQDQCPKYRNNEDAKISYCYVVPNGLCCPEYSDSYCETFNNNPRGPKPDNRADSIRRSCASGQSSSAGASQNQNCGSQMNANQFQQQSNSGCGGRPMGNSNVRHNEKDNCNCKDGGASFNYKAIYVGFNENLSEGGCC